MSEDRGASAFANRVQSDGLFFKVYLAAIWMAMAVGFAWDAWQKFLAGKLDYPPIIHIHAVIFVAWLVLFTVQVLQIERGSLARHRQLGRLAIVLTPAMLIAGPWASIAMDRIKYGHPKTAFPFMAIQFTNVTAACGLIVAGLLKRKDASAHKRLMLMSVMALMEPGLSRFLSDPLEALLGAGVWQFWTFTYIGSFLLMAGIGIYDWRTRGRTHPAWQLAFAWCLTLEWLASYLYYQPWWAEITARLVAS